MVNKTRLFNASCFALITTALSFSIRAGILGDLGAKFNLDDVQLGYINSMAFLGFPIAMILGGLFYNAIGPKKIMQAAFITHVLGIVLTIYAGGFWGLLISTFFVGFGNGCTEAACNPMIADTYSGSQLNKMMNRFHMWFPGGIVLGSLISKFMTDANLGWELQMWVVMIPTLIYFYLFYGQSFPTSKDAATASTLNNFKAMLSPLFLFMFLTMAITAITEFGPNQWVGPIMSNSGANPMLILALTTGLMAVGRFFGGAIVHKLDQVGVLLGSSIFAAIGIYIMSIATGTTVYFGAVIFAIGICYFWPTMLAFVAEKTPETGALGLSLVGGMGMFSTAIFQPIIGIWLDNAKKEQTALGKVGAEMELAAGQDTLGTMLSFPAVLIVLFLILFFWQKNSKSTAAHA